MPDQFKVPEATWIAFAKALEFHEPYEALSIALKKYNEELLGDEAVGRAGEAMCEALPPDLELAGGAWIVDPLDDKWGEWALNGFSAAIDSVVKGGENG